MYSEPVIRLGFANVEFDGGPEDKPAVLPERWHQAHRFLASLELDWLGRAEMTYSQWRPVPLDATTEERATVELTRTAADRRFEASQQVLKMVGFRAPMGDGVTPTGLFFRPETFRFLNRYERRGVWHNPPTNVVLALPEVPEREIMTVAGHTSYNSITRRRLEGEDLTTFADKVQAKYGNDPAHFGRAFWGAGDFNEYPVPGGETVPEINWAAPEITDLVHREHRAVKQCDGSWRSCTDLDERMMRCGMWDPARYAAHRLGQGDALAPTAGHASDGQGGGQRIDRFYMDPWIVQAVLEVHVHRLDGISDHDLPEVILSRRKLVEGLRRQFRRLEPWPLELVA